MVDMVNASSIKPNIAHEEKMTKKIKIMTLSDMPFSPSGVGTQTKYIIESLLKTGRYSFVSLGGAIKHPKYDPIKTREWEDDWVVYPVDGYGNEEIVRSIVRNHKPDMVWFMTDPRFWHWLWSMENEIRPLMPMIYYHVWDNYPYPKFNKLFYDSNDAIATISKLTDDVVKNVSPDVRSLYIPHAVDTEVFKPGTPETDEETKKAIFGENYDPNKIIFFWNNRNARRKQSGSLVFWFGKFLEKIGKDKAILIMHTDVKDENGQDLEAIAKNIGLTGGEIVFSQNKVSAERLASVLQAVDCTINIADAEGFGLATLESLACGTPVIVTMTGGLQEQVTDGDKWFGIGIEPTSKAIIGSQQIPYIYEDRLSEDAVVGALTQMYEASKEQREEWGTLGREHVLKNYNFENYGKQWDNFLTDIHESEGSWSTRRKITQWELKEVAV